MTLNIPTKPHGSGWTRRRRPDPFHRAAARSSESTVTERDVTDAMLLPADLIGGDETIIFAIKPSPWYIVFDSANWVIGSLCLVACASWFAEFVRLSESQFMSAVLTVLALRIGLALLRWVSRFYVLTNRRIMRVRGVHKPDVFECPLVNVRNTNYTTSFPEALTGLGTLNFMIHNPEDRMGRWKNVKDPEYIHTEVRKAIERAIDSQPHI